ncbi:MAG: hypothetical protein ABII18_04975 [bacterium]|nr:hypothetical protein [bacterium]MBU1918260.1 hypothetical protein [bacterium]
MTNTYNRQFWGENNNVINNNVIHNGCIEIREGSYGPGFTITNNQAKEFIYHGVDVVEEGNVIIP